MTNEGLGFTCGIDPNCLSIRFLPQCQHCRVGLEFDHLVRVRFRFALYFKFSGSSSLGSGLGSGLSNSLRFGICDCFGDDFVVVRSKPDSTVRSKAD